MGFVFVDCFICKVLDYIWEEMRLGLNVVLFVLCVDGSEFEFVYYVPSTLFG